MTQNKLISILEKNKIDFEESAVWLTQKGIQRKILSGWKLHVSAYSENAVQIASAVIKAIKPFSKTTFKCCKDIANLEKLNNGEYGITQKGKFLTVYIFDQSKVLEVAIALHRSLLWHKNYPHIKNELELGNGIYARYGNYLNQDRRDKKSGQKQQPLLRLPNGKTIKDSRQKIDNSLIESNPFQKSFVFNETIKDSIKENGSQYPEDLYNLNLMPIEEINSTTYKCLKADSKSNKQGIKAVKIAALVDKKACNTLHKIHELYKAIDLSDLDQNKTSIHRGQRYCIFTCDFVEGISYRQILEEACREKPYWELSEYDRTKIQEVLIKTINAVIAIHKLGIAHCDLTPNNIIISNKEEINFIDFETAEFVNGSSSKDFFGYTLSKATDGYFSNSHCYSCLEAVDAFSFGIILLETLFRIHPSRINIDSLKSDHSSIQHFNPFEGIALNILNIMRENGGITQYLPIVQSLNTIMCTPRLSETKAYKTNHFLANNYISKSIDQLAISQKENMMWETFHESDYNNPVIDGSFNHGNSGIFLFLAKTKKYLHLDRPSPSPSLLVDRLLNFSQFGDKNVKGLHFGYPGILFCCLKIMELYPTIEASLCESIFNEVRRISLDDSHFSGYDITHGIAGKLQLLNQANKIDGNSEFSALIQKNISTLCEKQSSDGSWSSDTRSMDPASSLGFAHGVSGIIYSLACSDRVVEDSLLKHSLQGAIHFLFSNIANQDDRLYFTNSAGSNTSHWWCRGEAGTILTLLKLAETFEDDTFYDYACQLVPFKNKSINSLATNISQCHGLSGLGEAYLSLYSAKHEEQWLTKAERIESFIYDLTFDPDKNNGVITNALNSCLNPSLMTGYTGVSHFLLRYTTLLNSNFDIGHPAL